MTVLAEAVNHRTTPHRGEIRGSLPPDDSIGDISAVLKRWRNDPVAFVKEALHAVPDEWQVEALTALAKGDRLAIRAGHGVGKSTTFAWSILWFLTTRYPAKIPCTSPTAHQLFDVLWAEVTLWHRKLPTQIQSQINILNDRIELAGAPLECFASARTARKEKPDALQGFHSENLLFLVDEAAGVEDIIFEVASGAMSTKGAKLALIGNPTKLNGYFYRAFQPGSLFHKIHVNAENVKRAQGVVEEISRNYGKDSDIYRVRVMGDFPSANNDSLISLELVESAMGRDIQSVKKNPVWGVDVARFGDDTTCLVRRYEKHCEPPTVWRQLSTMEVAGRIKNLYDNTPATDLPGSIYVDSIGVGAGVVDRLHELGLPVVGVNVSESPSMELGQAYRLRDELWLNALAWLETRQVVLPTDERLGNELCCVKKSFTSSGKVKIESKDELKKRGLRSPDVADAFCLTFAYASSILANIQSSRASDWKKPIHRAGATYI